jgi:hypothetical protein
MMDSIDVGPAGLVTIGIIAGAFISGAVCFLVYKTIGAFEFGSRTHRHEAFECFEELVARIRILEQKQNVLGDYSGEYFNTLKEAGWEELVVMAENLRSLSNELHIMLDQKMYAEVKAVCDYLLGRLGEKEAKEVAAAYEGLAELQDWRQTSREILLRVIQATTKSAQETQELGISRKRRERKPTLMSLSDLRGSLGDF